jgi:hypothetical protein
MQGLAALHAAKRIQLRVVAIAAADRVVGGRIAEDFSDFLAFLGRLGISDAEILLPFAICDITHLDHAILASEADEQLEAEIWGILFPNCPVACPSSGSSDVGKWLNRKCDSMSMWCHIHYDGDMFVTSDWNFHKPTKIQRLIALGAGRILKPNEALKFLSGI